MRNSKMAQGENAKDVKNLSAAFLWPSITSCVFSAERTKGVCWCIPFDEVSLNIFSVDVCEGATACHPIYADFN